MSGIVTESAAATFSLWPRKKPGAAEPTAPNSILATLGACQRDNRPTNTTRIAGLIYNCAGNSQFAMDAVFTSAEQTFCSSALQLHLEMLFKLFDLP